MDKHMDGARGTLWIKFMNNYVEKMGGGGQKMSVFVHAHGIKTVNSEKREGGSKNDKILSTWLLNDPLWKKQDDN